MATYALVSLLVVFLPLCRTLAVVATEASGTVWTNNSSGSGGGGGGGGGPATASAGTGPGPGPGTGPEVSSRGFSVDSAMVQRALYVLVAISAFGLLYFLVRAVRVKRPPPRKKYGVLAHSEDAVELTAAAASDDEDDTLYDARSLRR
ncbi:protein FAM174C [Syngnathoides biaculeatus]|uniref:protein FAM174C n=1 Tax=Syngnathoides biaculeatus TaxID=300417 RepID=UPI002ADE2A8D|nr:protein FAM174C [Syngnathoides biaculeatus]